MYNRDIFIIDVYLPRVTSRERQYSVSRDMQRPIRIEVTVPVIRLPSLSKQTPPTEEIPDVAEQICLLAPVTSAQQDPTATYQEIARGEASTYSTQAGLFRLLECTATFISGQRYLLRILRATELTKKRAAPEMISPGLTEQLVLSLRYRHHGLDEHSSEEQTEMQPGLTQVAISLNEEDTPDGYYIDGVEW